jgi:hypothetical protein
MQHPEYYQKFIDLANKDIMKAATLYMKISERWNARVDTIESRRG